MARYSIAPLLACGSLITAAVLAACGDSSGPSDTTVDLFVNAVTSPTNQPTQVISGTSDLDATVTITGPADSVSGPVGGGGAFSFTLDLALNSLNEFELSTVDAAGNTRSDTVEILHDNIAPSLTFTAPGSGTTTGGQSGFSVDLAFSDESSGIDVAVFELASDKEIGGRFRQDGTFSPTVAPGTDLVSLTSVQSSGANWQVPDSLPFPPGAVQLNARIADLAGNPSERTLAFDVGPDPNRLIVVDAGGAAGSTGNAVVVGLANPDSVGGVQFDLAYDTLVIAALDSVTLADRTSGFDDPPFNEITAGQARVLLFDSGGGRLMPGQGPILTLWVSVAAGAPAGVHTLTLDSIVLSDGSGGTSAATAAGGNFTVP